MAASSATGRVVGRAPNSGYLSFNFSQLNPHLTDSRSPIRWADIDLDAKVVTSMALPQFAEDMLHRRKGGRQGPNTAGVIFPSSAGTLRDPDNFGKAWREVRDDLGLPDVSSHSFRKAVATLIHDSGLSSRLAADQLGHARVSMTTDTYMSRKQVHTEVADVLDKTVGISDD